MAASKESKSLVPTMLGSATSGMLARIPTHPIDTVKARLQVQTGSGGYRHALHALSSIMKAEGVPGLYRGFQIAFAGSAPAACLYFSSYEASKDWLGSHDALKGKESTVSFAAGMIAEAMSCVLWVPIDVIKERMQIQPHERVPRTSIVPPAGAPGATAATRGVYYRGPVHAIRYTIQTEGVIGLYRGYGATLMSFGPFSGLYFVFYERMKKAAYSMTGTPSGADLPFHAFVLCGAGAGTLASFVTNPLDVVKLRLQVQRSKATQHLTQFSYRNMVDGLGQVVRTEGLAGMFRGVGARMAFHAPTTAISLSLFEQCKIFYTRLLGDRL